jgi:hypothetical protein
MARLHKAVESSNLGVRYATKLCEVGFLHFWNRISAEMHQKRKKRACWERDLCIVSRAVVMEMRLVIFDLFLEVWTVMSAPQFVRNDFQCVENHNEDPPWKHLTGMNTKVQQ